jgi:hypothetical protein
VEAHSAVFLQGAHYEDLIADVGARVVGWVADDLSRRAIVAMILEGEGEGETELRDAGDEGPGGS